MLLSPQLEAKTNAIKVIIIEDYKLTRVGLRYALNEFDYIDVIGECTCCNPNKYFSHRHSNGHRGTMLNVIFMG